MSSTLEVIANGAWDSGESLTVRLTSENLNTNTLTEQDMAIDDDALPVLIQGDPITLHTVDIAPEDWRCGIWRGMVCQREHPSGNTEGNKYHHHVYRNTDRHHRLERLTSDTMSSYVHYSSEKFAAATTDAQLNTTGLGLEDQTLPSQ